MFTMRNLLIVLILSYTQKYLWYIYKMEWNKN